MGYLRLTLVDHPGGGAPEVYAGGVLDAVDIILIHQLLGRYGHAIDHRQWGEFGELFVPEATIDYRGSSGRVERAGRAAIVEWFQHVDTSHPPAHHVTNIVVDEHGDPDAGVDVHSKFIAPFTQAHHLPKRIYGGDYHDLVVKREGRWLFLHKQCIPRWNLAVQIDNAAPEHRRTY